jgi:hypothetical protein
VPSGRRAVPRLRLGFLAAIAAVLMFFGLQAGVASAAVITFDDLNAPPRGSGTGLAVNSQYEALGVTFNNPSAHDYSQGGAAIPGFAHSGTAAVEPCFAVEFCTSPVTAVFTAGQESVRVWVGFAGPLVEPVGVRLTAFDAGSAVVGTADATLPASANPTPIQTPLAIDLPSATIRRVEVSVTTGGGFTGGLGIDDVEFSTAGPPPPCPASGPPMVNVSQPPDGLVVQNNRFILQGSVDARGAPITSAAVVTQAATPRTASIFPTLVDPDGGPFGRVRFNGFLGPGQNRFVVAATNCAGTGSSAPRTVTWTPIPAGTRFRQLGMIEVTQAVQDRFNAVPLIAASPNGAKRTFARVYLRVDGGPTQVSVVSGTLTAIRPDGTRPPGPLRVSSLNKVTVVAGATVESARSSLQNSLNFELPREWLDAGQLHIQLEHLEVEGVQSTLPCDDCDNHFPGNSLPATVTFHAVPPLRIRLVSVPWRTSPTAAANTPSPLDRNLLTSWLQRAYPSAEVQVNQLAMPVRDEAPGSVDDNGNVVREGFLCDELNGDLSEFAATLPAQNRRTKFYGLVSDAGGNFFMQGCADPGGRFGSGPAGASAGSWDTDGSYADWYGGHELGHMYGRKHPGGCPNRGETYEDHPPTGGLIGGPNLDSQGIDAGNTALGLPFRLYDWRNDWSDVMTYCDKQWISAHTYLGILRNLCEGDTAACPSLQPLARRGRSAAAAAQRGPRGPRLSVTGTLVLRSGRLSLAPLWVRPGLRLSQRPRRSNYAIVLRGAGGRRLARYPFRPDVMSDPPSPRRATALVDEVVPFRSGTRRIVVTRGRRTLASVRVSAYAPRVRLLAPTGRRLRGRVTVRWRSRDADGGRRWYTLLYTHDGKRFIPVAAGLRRTSLRVDLRRVPGGSRARFMVIAGDGVRTGSDRSDRPFRVAVKRPRVLISAPQQGAEFAAGQPVSFLASVSDLQQLQLPARGLVWRSDVQGELGRGLAITAALKPGNHVISLQATNRGGKSSVARLAVTVAAVPPLFDANAGP